MKVYIVTEGSYSDFHNVAVFSSKEKAEEFIKEYNPTDDTGIEDYDLDDLAGAVKTIGYSCQIWLDTGEFRQEWSGDALARPGVRAGEVQESLSPSYLNTAPRIIITVTSYVDKDHARKLAVEARQERIRLKGTVVDAAH